MLSIRFPGHLGREVVLLAHPLPGRVHPGASRWWCRATLLILFGMLAPGSFAAAFEDGLAPTLRSAGPAEVIAAAPGDFDGDGRPDLALAGETGGVALFRATVSGGFTNQTYLLPQAFAVRAEGVSWVDIDNDGDLDLWVTAWGTGHVLYRNPGSGTWKKEEGAALGVPVSSGMSTAWSDANGDGRADLLMASGGGAAEESPVLRLGSASGLLLAPSPDPVTGSRAFGAAVSWADADGDGDLDALFVNGWLGPNQLFRNGGAGGWTAVVPSPLRAAGETTGGGGCAWGDYDNDGDLDLYVTGGGYGDGLYRNEGNGAFTRFGRFVGLQAADLGAPGGATVGVVWADLDNDGWLDLLVSNRTGPLHQLRNLGDGRFQAVTREEMGPADWPNTSNGFAVADFDRDGFLDVVVGSWPGGGARYFRNLGALTNQWLQVRLRGTRSHPSGLGALVRATASLGGRAVTQVRQIGGEDGWGTHEAVAHFGLGRTPGPVDVEVRWPSGLRTVREGLVAGREWVITEDEELTVLPTSGLYAGTILVRIEAPNLPGSGIRFTRDGSEPSEASETYAGPFVVQPPISIRARQFVGGSPVGPMVERRYDRDPGVYLSPASSVFTNRLEVSASARVAGVELRYTLDGTEPSLTALLYAGPISLSARTTIRVRAFLNGFPVSDVATGEYRCQYVFPPDGIPESWRLLHFGPEYLTDPRAAADADPDADGSSNAQEHAAGTLPLDPASGFVVGIRTVPEIRFFSVAGTKYRILRHDRLAAEPVVVVDDLLGVGGWMRYVDGSIEEGPGFYVVESKP